MTGPGRRSSRRSRSLQRGSVSVEYLVLLSVVSLLFAAVIAGWGPPFVRAYERTRAILVSPVP